MHRPSVLVPLLAVAAVLATAAPPAAADRGGDASARLMRLSAMDTDKDGRISKAEFLEMVGKVWDEHQPDMKAADGKLTPEQLLKIQKTLAHPIGK